MNSDTAAMLNRIALKDLESLLTFNFNKNTNIVSKGWAKIFVEAEQPIPESLRSEFYDELVSPDLGYRKALEESISYFGVRWNNT